LEEPRAVKENAKYRQEKTCPKPLVKSMLEKHRQVQEAIVCCDVV
jgi:hypothetical protein